MQPDPNNKVEQYLHHYIGANILYDVSTKEIAELTPKIYANIMKLWNGWRDPKNTLFAFRPLTDITEQECRELTGYNKFQDQRNLIRFEKNEEFAQIIYEYGGQGNATRMGQTGIFFDKTIWTAYEFIYLVKSGFDIFNILGSRLTVNKTQL